MNSLCEILRNFWTPKRMIVINATLMKIIYIILAGVPVSMNLVHGEGSKLYTLGLMAAVLRKM